MLLLTNTTTKTIEEFSRADMIFHKYRNLHFVGIGGAGMSGMAIILHNLGYRITGSDITPTEITEHLQRLGITVYDHHDGDFVKDVDLVVISSAVTEENPEVQRAVDRGIPVIKRAEMLGELMRLKFSFGVAGSHGKTTTTAMLGAILSQAQKGPTVLIGGRAVQIGSDSHLGRGEIMVAEADEFDRSFLKMFPTIAVVTNIEEDHLDIYRDLEDMLDSFSEYLSRVPFYGSVVLPEGDRNVERIRDRIKRPVITFGFDPQADIRAENICFENFGSRFTLMVRGEARGELSLRLPGKHNVANSLAAIGAALELDVPFEAIEEALRKFHGVTRRFQLHGSVNGITIIDDYAHHPSEIAATLTGLRQEVGTGKERIIAVFQPHLYSRTRDFYRQFAEALHNADRAIVVDIYPAREKPMPGITAQLIVDYAAQLGYKHVTGAGAKENAVEAVAAVARPGDYVITLGAGDVFRIIPALKGRLES
jgi:UDP-N-acetylmuramate--alanine ligase